MRVERSLEETRAGLRFKAPKTRNGRRSISLPPSAVEGLRAHRRRQLELRMALGTGKPDPDALVFTTEEGNPLSPNYLSILWRRATSAPDLPRVKFHALRHTHASALIAAGIDVVTVSKRLGHGTPAITLNTYSHLFQKDRHEGRGRNREGAQMKADNEWITRLWAVLEQFRDTQPDKPEVIDLQLMLLAKCAGRLIAFYDSDARIQSFETFMVETELAMDRLGGSAARH